MYDIKFLESAQFDILEIANHITNELLNPIAADNLAKEIIESANRLIDFPYIFPIYSPLDKLEKEYRKFSVKNYFVFYYVEEESKKVLISRVIYSGRDIEHIVK